MTTRPEPDEARPALEINQMQLSWSPKLGQLYAMDIPAALFWLDPSLRSILTPLALEIGFEMFSMHVAWSASQGTAEDYEAMVTVFADNFADGFLAWGAAVGAAGWGVFELPEYDPETKTARVIVRHAWELLMQQKGGEHRWGCPFIQGKLIGLFTSAFGVPCWATEVEISYEGEPYVAFEIAPSELTIQDELNRLRQAQRDERERTLLRRLDQMTAELQDSLREMQAARDEARLASAAKSEFLASMSHELRTPLNSILGYAELVREELLDRDLEDLSQDLEKVSSAGRHLLSLISQVLELARIEQGKMELTLGAVPLRGVMAEVSRIISPLAVRKGLTLRIDGVAEDVHVQTDELRLQQILVNLMSNACKFTEAGEVRLTIELEEEAVRWIVSDTGIGMNEEQRARVFEMFTQADDTIKYRFGGTGLGLTISSQLATLLGGSIQVESTLHEGSTFIVELPRHYD